MISQDILHWKIDNASVRLSRGSASAGSFPVAGFSWQLSLLRSPLLDNTSFVLNCQTDHNGPWSCTVEVEWLLVASSGLISEVGKRFFDFDEDNDSCPYHSGIAWMNLTDPWVVATHNDKLYGECRIRIIKSEKTPVHVPGAVINAGMFTVPDQFSDVALVIGDKKLHVSKQYLSIHSPVFAAMFTRNFAEKDKEEIELKEIHYEDFLELLHIIYPGPVSLNDTNLMAVLPIADRFQLQNILDQAQTLLQTTKKLAVVEKLRVADHYRMKALVDHCIHSCQSARELANLQLEPEFSEFSAPTVVAICGQLMRLVREGN